MRTQTMRPVLGDRGCRRRGLQEQHLGILELIAVGFVVGVVLVLLVLRRVFSPLTKVREELRSSQRQWQGVLDFLNVFSRSLAENREPADILHHVAHYVCRLLKSESAAIYRIEEHVPTGRPVLVPTAIHGPFPLLKPDSSVNESLPKERDDRLRELRDHPFELGEGLVGQAVQAKSGTIVRNAESLRGRSLPFVVDTCMVAPIRLRDQPVGVLCVTNRRFRGKPFDRKNLRVLEQLALQVGVGIDLLNIYDERSDQERLVQELDVGRDIQHSLLPPPLPIWHDYRIAAFSDPALEVAGDSYDIVEIDDHRLMILVADATGKGVPACMLSAMARSFVRSLAESFDGMEEFLVKLNSCIFNDTDTAHFLTMGVLVLDSRNDVCEYACAGHTPLFLKLSDGTTRSIAPDGPALGLLPNELGVEFDTLSFSFTPGTRVMLFSDGVNEALSPAGEEFGMKRMETLWEQRVDEPDQLCTHIVDELKRFVRERAQNDDRTLVIVSRDKQADDDPQADEASE